MIENINGKTKILGVIGDPIQHTLSPKIHNTLCKNLNLNYVYLPFNITSDNLENAIKGFKSMNITGFNVTIPHKENIIPYLDEVSKEALLMGAVNTVKNVNGKLHGYNTDGYGFYKSLKNNCINIKNKNIMILGAGGSARAISVKLALEGATCINILNRTIEKAKDICDIIIKEISEVAKPNLLDDNNIIKYSIKSDIIINTTPIGMNPKINLSPMNDFSFFNKELVVYDLIYNPKKTLLLSKAEEKGCKVINGWEMLIFQAIKAFEIWTEITVNDKLIKLFL